MAKENMTEEFSTVDTDEVKDENLEATEENIEESQEASEGTADTSKEENATSEEAEDASKKEKKASKKKKDKKDEQIEQLTDRVQRQMAEFENFRRRSETEKSQMFDVGAKSIVEKILPVVDNFERGLSTVEEGADPFSDGMLMIYKQLQTSLAEAGVTAIEAVGQEFNPDLHNAVMHVDDEEVAENIVVEEFQKGYMYRDQVVRHSMVKVAN